MGYNFVINFNRRRWPATKESVMKIANWIEEIDSGNPVLYAAPIHHLNLRRASLKDSVNRSSDGEWLDKSAALIWAGRCVVVAASAVADKPSRHDWAWRELFRMSAITGLPMAAILTMAMKCNQVSIWSDYMAEIKAARSILESYGKI